LDVYKDLVKRIITEYAAYKISYGEVETETIFDDAIGHYQLMHIGWIGQRRIHGCLLHVDVRDGKEWIQHDGTEEGIANELVEAVVPRDQIVLAFHHPETRKLTDFAIC
jgi:XisI protein